MYQLDLGRPKVLSLVSAYYAYLPKSILPVYAIVVFLASQRLVNEIITTGFTKNEVETTPWACQKEHKVPIGKRVGSGISFGYYYLSISWVVEITKLSDP